MKRSDALRRIRKFCEDKPESVKREFNKLLSQFAKISGNDIKVDSAKVSKEGRTMIANILNQAIEDGFSVSKSSVTLDLDKDSKNIVVKISNLDDSDLVEFIAEKLGKKCIEIDPGVFMIDDTRSGFCEDNSLEDLSEEGTTRNQKEFKAGRFIDGNPTMWINNKEIVFDCKKGIAYFIDDEREFMEFNPNDSIFKVVEKARKVFSVNKLYQVQVMETEDSEWVNDGDSYSDKNLAREHIQNKLVDLGLSDNSSFPKFQITDCICDRDDFSEIKSDDEFRKYAHTIMKEAHGDNYSEDITNKVVDDLLDDNPNSDYGELVGRLTSGLGE